MSELSKRPPDAAAIRVLIRIALAAYLASDDLLLQSAGAELSVYGMTLADIGIETPTAGKRREAPHG